VIGRNSVIGGADQHLGSTRGVSAVTMAGQVALSATLKSLTQCHCGPERCFQKALPEAFGLAVRFPLFGSKATKAWIHRPENSRRVKEIERNWDY